MDFRTRWKKALFRFSNIQIFDGLLEWAGTKDGREKRLFWHRTWNAELKIVLEINSKWKTKFCLCCCPADSSYSASTQLSKKMSWLSILELGVKESKTFDTWVLTRSLEWVSVNDCLDSVRRRNIYYVSKINHKHKYLKKILQATWPWT